MALNGKRREKTTPTNDLSAEIHNITIDQPSQKAIVTRITGQTNIYTDLTKQNRRRRAITKTMMDDYPRPTDMLVAAVNKRQKGGENRKRGVANTHRCCVSQLSAMYVHCAMHCAADVMWTFPGHHMALGRRRDEAGGNRRK